AHDARSESRHRQFAHRTLPFSADFLVRHDEDTASAVAEVEQRTAKRSPRVRRNPEQLGGTAVLGICNPDHWLLHRRVRRIRHVGVAEHVAVKAARFYTIDTVFWRPMAFLVGHEKSAIII